MIVWLLLLTVVAFIIWCFLIFLPPLTLFKLKETREIPRWVLQSPIAHRGLHKLPDVPENSLAAFQSAKEEGFGIELDVHLSKDGEVVVHHDSTLERLTGKQAQIADLTYDKISKLKLLKTEQRIPTLNEVLDLIQGDVPLYIEIKNKENEIGPLEEAVYELIQGYGGPVAVISFNPKSLEWYKLKAPEILRGQNSSTFTESQDKKINILKRFAFRNYLFNWTSQPDFLVHELKGIEGNFTLALLRKYKVILTYGAADRKTLQQAQNYGDNFMFDHVAQEISKQQIAQIDVS